MSKCQTQLLSLENKLPLRLVEVLEEAGFLQDKKRLGDLSTLLQDSDTGATAAPLQPTGRCVVAWFRKFVMFLLGNNTAKIVRKRWSQLREALRTQRSAGKEQGQKSTC